MNRPKLQTARTVNRTARLLRRLRTTEDRWAREQVAYAILEILRDRILPQYRLTDYGKSWFEDEAYFADYRRFCSNDLSADRKFFLRELLKLVASVDGDTAEAGVYSGASSWFICEARTGRRSTHWAFDSFDGLPEPDAQDGNYWRAGDLTAAEATARNLLEPYDARVLRGWIPEVFEQAEIERLAFCHIDVDLYEPTLSSLEYFYPRLTEGAVLVCDDYGFATCPGATRAIDEFMAGRPEPVLHCPTGQAIILKR